MLSGARAGDPGAAAVAVRAVNFASSAQLEGEIYPLTVCTLYCSLSVQAV